MTPRTWSGFSFSPIQRQCSLPFLICRPQLHHFFCCFITRTYPLKRKFLSFNYFPRLIVFSSAFVPSHTTCFIGNIFFSFHPRLFTHSLNPCLWGFLVHQTVLVVLCYMRFFLVGTERSLLRIAQRSSICLCDRCLILWSLTYKVSFPTLSTFLWNSSRFRYALCGPNHLCLCFYHVPKLSSSSRYLIFYDAPLMFHLIFQLTLTLAPFLPTSAHSCP